MTPTSFLGETNWRLHGSRTALVAGLTLAADTLGAQTRPLTADALGTFVDSVVNAVMTREKIPGAAFVFVKDGRILLSRGYGYADMTTRRRVSPDSTLFRIGSISKVFTATAVMQLVDRGRIALDANVNRYLKGLQVDSTFPHPVLVSHLLEHTAGFDEIGSGRQARDEGGILPLSRFLANRLVRVSAPGAIPSYSTYGITLAGLIVEDVSGASYEQFLKANIWKPLGMRDTRITLTTPLRQRLATPYEYVNGVHAVQPFEWYHTIPASSISSTAADMARFMLAHLAPKPALMRAQSRRVMHSTHARGHPDVPGVAYGFFEGDYAGQRVLEHGGAMAGTSTNMVLLPAHAAGFFVASQLEGNPLGGILKEAILDHFFASDNAGRRPSAFSGAEPPLASFAGRYRWNVYCRSCGGAAPAQGPSVTVSDDALMFAGRRWMRVAPLLFRRDDGARVIGFRQDQRGRITHLFIDGALTFERID